MPVRFQPPVTLAGRYVRLEPLEIAHAAALARIASDPETVRYLLKPPGPTVEEATAFVRELLGRQAAGTDLAFAILDGSTRDAIGMTRYLRIERENDSVEIGGTLVDRPRWRTPVNTEAKYLLLRHAFESEGAHRVTLQTDLRNDRSQRAIERLGTTREGLLREDRRLPDGRFRSSVLYSLLADEWPRTRARLEASLARPWPGPSGRTPAPEARLTPGGSAERGAR